MRVPVLLASLVVPVAACSSLDEVESVDVTVGQTQLIGAAALADDGVTGERLTVDLDLGCASHGQLDVTVNDEPATYFDGGSFSLWSCDRANAFFDDDLGNHADDAPLDVRVRSSFDELAIAVPRAVLDRRIADASTVQRQAMASFPYALAGAGLATDAIGATLWSADGTSSALNASSTTDAIVAAIPDEAAAGPAILEFTLVEQRTIEAEVPVATLLVNTFRIAVTVE